MLELLDLFCKGIGNWTWTAVTVWKKKKERWHDTEMLKSLIILHMLVSSCLVNPTLICSASIIPSQLWNPLNIWLSYVFKERDNRFTFAVKIKTSRSISRTAIVWKCSFSAALYFHSNTFWKQIFCFFPSLNVLDNFIYELLCIFCDYLMCKQSDSVLGGTLSDRTREEGCIRYKVPH